MKEEVVNNLQYKRREDGQEFVTFMRASAAG